MRKSKSIYLIKPFTIPSVLRKNRVLVSAWSSLPLHLQTSKIALTFPTLSAQSSASALPHIHSPYSVKNSSCYGATSKKSNAKTNPPKPSNQIVTPLQLRTLRVCRSNAALRNMASGRPETGYGREAPASMMKAMIMMRRRRHNLGQMKILAGSADGGFGVRRSYENILISSIPIYEQSCIQYPAFYSVLSSRMYTQPVP